jgi:transposase-like protein
MQKRRKFTAAFQAQVVLEVLTGVQSAAQVCQEHQIKDSLLSRWKQEFLEHAPQVFD